MHFATHGLWITNAPRLSGLVLRWSIGNGQSQEGYFRLHDIYNLKLPRTWLFSARAHRSGKEIKGEGLIGVTRGFMYAAQGAVWRRSLWKVDDEATAALMTRFDEGMSGKDGHLRPRCARHNSDVANSKRWRARTFGPRS